LVVVPFGKDDATRNVPWKQRQDPTWRAELSRADVLVTLPSFLDANYRRIPNDALRLSVVLAHIEIKSRGEKAPGWKIPDKDFRWRLEWQEQQRAAHRQVFEGKVPAETAAPVLYALVSQDPRDTLIGLIPLDVALRARRRGVWHFDAKAGLYVVDWILPPEMVAGRYWYDRRDTRPLWEQQPQTRPDFILNAAQQLAGGPARVVDVDSLPSDVLSLPDEAWTQPAVLSDMAARIKRSVKDAEGNEIILGATPNQLEKLYTLANQAESPMPLVTNRQDASRHISRLERMLGASGAPWAPGGA
jgi:uncharacterized protein YfaQ (DUF2300 family)